MAKIIAILGNTRLCMFLSEDFEKIQRCLFPVMIPVWALVDVVAVRTWFETCSCVVRDLFVHCS
jgi:hypothetical protein